MREWEAQAAITIEGLELTPLALRTSDGQRVELTGIELGQSTEGIPHARQLVAALTQAGVVLAGSSTAREPRVLACPCFSSRNCGTSAPTRYRHVVEVRELLVATGVARIDPRATIDDAQRCRLLWCAAIAAQNRWGAGGRVAVPPEVNPVVNEWPATDYATFDSCLDSSVIGHLASLEIPLRPPGSQLEGVRDALTPWLPHLGTTARCPVVPPPDWIVPSSSIDLTSNGK